MLVRMRFENLDEPELKYIKGFLNWLCEKIFIYLNREANRKRIEARLEYMKKVRWINWIGSKDITVDMLMKSVQQCFKIRKRKEIWEIYFDDRIMIPNTNTPITKFLRFIDSGDNKVKGTGMIQFIRRRFNHVQLNKWWQTYIFMKTCTLTHGKIISD